MGLRRTLRSGILVFCHSTSPSSCSGPEFHLDLKIKESSKYYQPPCEYLLSGGILQDMKKMGGGSQNQIAVSAHGLHSCQTDIWKGYKNKRNWKMMSI